MAPRLVLCPCRLFKERSSKSRETSMSAVPDEVMKYVAAENDDDPRKPAEWLQALVGVISLLAPIALTLPD